jgi:amino acid adenylation domain-containing protein
MSETFLPIAELSSQAKRAMLADLLKKKAETRESFYPLSYGQRAWWFMHQLESESAACNIVFASRVNSAVDVAALSRAFQTLIDRHPSLRTNFINRDSEPVQFVRRRQKLRFKHRHVDASNPEELKRCLIEEANRPFDLEREPMLRVSLYTSSPEEHVLLMMAHHIAVDLWSLVVLMNELRELYPAEIRGERVNLPTPSLQYTDYVREQSEMLAGAKGARLWDYWKNQLAGELPVMNLPLDRTRPAVLTYEGAYHDRELDAELSQKLKSLSRTCGATLYATLLAAFQVLLYRYSGQEEIMVGALYATGRDSAGFAGVVGFLDNPVALRANLSANPTFKDYLERVSRTTLDALEHQEYPFGLLVERLQPVRELSRAPIFQVMFILQKTQLAEEASLLAMARGHAGARVNLGGLALEYADFEKRVATGIAGRLDLTLTMAETSAGLSASFQYNTELFDATTMARMAAHFQKLLEGIVANPSAPIETLPLLSETERHHQLIEWNTTVAPYPQAECLHTLMTKRAEIAPHHAAISCGGQTCSYAELDRRSNQLARYLQALGVKRGVLVGVCVERSIEMVVAVLGILKAGAAYVPLDPAYPQQRIAFMLEDTHAPVLLTQAKLVETLPASAGETVCLDTDWTAIDAESDRPVTLDTMSTDIAYVIYTSGSTGNPKGVMINHRGAVNTIIDVNRRFAVGPDDRILALSSLSFDLSVYDIFGTLAAGATIVIPDASAVPNPRHWAELMWREQVTVWNSAPALMEMFVEHLSCGAETMPDSLRLVMLSGDWIPVSLPQQIKALAAGAQVFSLGGATEASIWSIIYPIERVEPTWKSIPYGRPMANQHFYVLNAHGQPVPQGVVGELYIGGIGIAQGYLNRPELSAEKFIPDPFNGEAGGYLYRTGDLGCFLADGNIEFLGRMDHQVKLRGFRIELGEIEGVLTQHPSVRETVVLARTDGQSEKRLVAYIVARAEEALAASSNGDESASAQRVWDALVMAGREQAHHPALGMEAGVFQSLTRHLDALARSYVSLAFRNLGVFTRSGEEHSISELIQSLPVVPRYHKALRRWLELLSDEGKLEQQGEIFRSVSPLNADPPDALLEAVRASNDELTASVAYFQYCGEKLSGVLTGKMHPTQLLFREGASAVAENFYQEGFRYCNTIVRDVVKSLVESAPPEKSLRILEVGAGVGSTTAWLLPELPARRTSYFYTDVSKYFTEIGQRNFTAYPFIHYDLLDIEREPQEQGYEPQSFDLIIASSVLHATKYIGETLQHVRSLLAPGGFLLLVEETRFHDYFNIVGLQEGFDRFMDEDVRERHPFLSADGWNQALLAHGFDYFQGFNESGSQAEEWGIDVMLARASLAVTGVEKNELRRFLRERLPEYMIPSHFMMLDALPLTPNGKVDRRALPAPMSLTDEPTRIFVAPRTPTEEVLAGIWAQVTGSEEVSIDDNFFDSGGDSLLATQLISRVRSAFQTELPLQNLFEFPTVAGLASRIEQSREAGQGESFQPIEPIARDGELPLSFAQQRIWFLDQLIPGSAFYNVLAAVCLKGGLDTVVLAQSLNEIIRRHETLRTTFASVGSQPVQLIATDGTLSLTEVDLRGVPEEEQDGDVQRLAKEEARRPFDLTMGPLLRVTLLRLKEDEFVLLLALHHIIFDGWSLGVLVRELGLLYNSYASGKPSPLLPLSIQYADFAHWQRQWLQGAVLEERLSYWKRQLAGSTVLELPTDYPRPAAQTFRGARQSFLLPGELIEDLRTLSHRESVTLFMTLLAGFKTLLHRSTGQEDIVVGSPIANRNRVETDKLIGFFVNALALRTRLSSNPGFRELLGRVRETALSAYAHQDLPFEKLVEELQPERHLTYTPLFHVWFVLQNAPLPPLELPSVTMSPIEVDDGTSKFDLVISLFETDGGLRATWIYNSDLFEPPTIARLAKQYETLLGQIVAHPEARLTELEIESEAEKEQRAVELEERQRSRVKRLRTVRRRAVDWSQMVLVKTGALLPEQTFPLVISPQVEQVDLSDWAHNNQPFIEDALSKHGALLFRGFQVASASEFEQFALANCPELFGEYGDLPREEVSGKVYGSTPYPADQPILLHNESSQMHCWPLKVWFYCARAADEGGETPIVDCRRVYQLLQPDVRERFQRQGLMYVRNFTDGLDVGWQEFFRTKERRAVEEYCRRVQMEFEWTKDNGLRTRKKCPAVAKHPKTSEMVFFNQIQAHHISFLAPAVRHSLLSLFTMEELPRNVYYGDGSCIEDAVIDEIRRIYREAQTSFAWQAGDIMMLDNMLAAHGRNPYTGPRKIMVAMGEMIQAQDLH